MDIKKDQTEAEKNVVSIFAARRKSDEKTSSVDESHEGFEEIVKKNKLAQEKMKKERTKVNQSVLRSYRLKT